MASYSKTDVQNANLPVADMIKRLDPKTHRGDKAKFFAHVVRFAVTASGKSLTEEEINKRAGNLAFQFTRFAGGYQDTFPTGADVSLTDLATAWTALNNGTLILNGGNGHGVTTNGNNGGSTPETTSSQTGTEKAREEAAKNVPPVSQNVFASALAVFDGLRTRDESFTTPRNADDAYELLWDHLAEPVKDARASGVISATLARLVAENRVLFDGIITILPEEARAALEEVLIDKTYDTYKTSLKSVVEDVYHISVGKRHAASMFSAWASQVVAITNWMGKDEGLGWTPGEEQVLNASRDHAVATFRALAEGLRAEVASATPLPAPAPSLAPIQFNTIMGRLLTKGPEIMAEVGGRWGAMTPEQQHAFVKDMDAEDAKAAEAPKPETKDEAKAAAPAPKAGNAQDAKKA